MEYKTAYNLAKRFAKKFLSGNRVHIVGSLRRHAATVKDIDFLIVDDSNKSEQIYNNLETANVKILSSGNKKILLTYNDKRIDIFFTSSKDLIPAMLHFTGSKIFNIRMRQKAKELGYTLNQYGLFTSDGKKVKIKNEKDIFKLLDMKYKKPDERDH